MKPSIDFKYEPGHLVENQANNKFNKEHNPDTPGLSFRFYVWLTLGFCIVISTVLYFAPAIDHNPIFALLFLITIAIGLWKAIDWQARKSRV